MKIKTKFNIITVVFLAFVVALVLTLFMTSQQVSQLEREHRTTENIVRAVFGLDIITNDYLMHPGERALQQWQARYDSITDMIETLEFDNSEKQHILKEMGKTHKSIEPIFSQLANPDISKELRDRLVGQLLVKSQGLVGEASRLSEITFKEEYAIQETSRRITFMFMIIMSVLIIVTWLMVANISGPIQKLRHTAIEVGKGNFKAKAGIKTNDELEDLSKSIDKMVLDLHRVKLLETEKAIKDILEMEIRKKTASLNIKLKEADDTRIATMNMMEDLTEAIEEQKRLEKIKTEFLSVTSHELRTPITPMRAQLQMVMQGYFGKLTAKQKKSLQMVINNTTRLDRLIEDILDISRIESGNLKFIMAGADMNETIRNGVETMRFKAEERNLKLELKAEKMPKLIMDKNRITQVVVNLINNSIKFTDPGGRITVRLRKTKDNAEVSVTDTGIGIAEDDLGRIFYPFEQVDSSASRNYEGTGLGLAICRGIIAGHGGEISVKSQLKKGSTFSFTLPLRGMKRKEKKIDLFTMHGHPFKALEKERKFKIRKKI
jgi:signal transduction histidine kinase